MSKFLIAYGLGGSFGGCGEWEECPYVTTLDEAEKYAYEAACQEYESYDGLHGLENEESIREEYPDISDGEVYEIYCDSRESWLCYKAREIK